MKKIFLASSGSHPETIRKLKNFVGGKFKDKKIVYVPTATNGKAYGRWKNTDTIKSVFALGAHVEVLELESCFYQDIYPIIKSGDILWFSGGLTGYLLYYMRRCELDKHLPELLQKGIVYVGASAGACALSKTQDVQEWYIGESEIGASRIPGLGLIDFEIYPHYQESLLPEIKKRWKKGELYLLKDGEVITFENNKMQVLGEKRILKE